MSDQMIICIIDQLLLLRSKQNSCSTLVLQAFTHPCANQLQVAVTEHSSSRGEICEKTDPTNVLSNQKQNNTVNYSAYREPHHPCAPVHETRHHISTVHYCIIHV